MLQETEKIDIASEVAVLVDKTSQKRVANNAGVSNALISQVVNQKWASISDEMWWRLKVNLHLDFGWSTANTKNYELVHGIVKFAQDNRISIAISEDAGRGKTHAFRSYQRQHRNVVHLECKNSWSRKSYMRNLLITSGLSSIGTTEELIERFVKHLKGLSGALVIIDQFDKLKDNQMDLFMDFYNDLDGHCAFVLSGTKALKKRVLNGVNRDKVGYPEMYSRVGRKFIGLDPITKADVKLICEANGVYDDEMIDYIFSNSEGDLRRVRRDIEITQNRKVGSEKKEMATA